MKTLISKLIVLFGILLLLDYFSGYIFTFLQMNSKGGSTRNNYYILKESKDDVIILGSSRATHHYKPEIIQDSLRLSCYNCGEEGNGIILAKGRLEMMLERHHPSVVLYEITPEYDYFADKDYTKYLRYLKPYYSEEKVSSLVNSFIDKRTQIELKSKLYQNNSLCLTYLLDNIVYRENNKGYSPLFAEMQKLLSNFPISDNDIDYKKLILLEELTAVCKREGIKLFYVISPICSLKTNNQYMEAFRLASRYQVEVWDYSCDKRFVGKLNLFNDNYHMNDLGAEMFSSIIASRLRNITDENL